VSTSGRGDQFGRVFVNGSGMTSGDIIAIPAPQAPQPPAETAANAGRSSAVVPNELSGYGAR